MGGGDARRAGAPRKRYDGSVRTRLAVLALAVVATAGCDSAGPEEDLPGIYPLRTVSGSSLPFVLQDNELAKVEVIGGEIRLTSAGAFSDQIDYHVTAPGGSPQPLVDLFTGTFDFRVTSCFDHHYIPVDCGG